MCGDDQTCQLPFGFRHQLSITGNSTNFEGAVLETVISANLDTPEGGFDALMQIAVCEVRKHLLHRIIAKIDNYCVIAHTE